MMKWKRDRVKLKALFLVTTRLLLTVIAVHLVQTEGAVAQERTTQKSVSEGTYQIEAMTVTAQKQEEHVQDVPVSITAFDGQSIDDMQMRSLKDLANFVPSLMIFDNGQSGMNSPSMRGLHAPVESISVSTGLYIDGVPVLSATGFEDGLMDIERIEVLRGPQGTLYGKGAEAGAINVITRLPDNEARGKICLAQGKLLSAEAGDKNKSTLSFNLSGPIKKDALYLGLSGQYVKRDGYIENTVTGDDVNSQERWIGKAHLRWTPADALDISLIASHLQYDDESVALNMGESFARMVGLPTPESRKVTSNLKGDNDTHSDTLALKVTYDINDTLKLTSVTSRRVFHDDLLDDWDFTEQTLHHSDKQNEYSTLLQELRLNYASDRFKWLAGLYYDKDEIRIDIKTHSPMGTALNKRDTEGNTYAAFGNVTVPVTDRCNVIVGLRYEEEEKDFENHISGQKVDESWNNLTSKFAVQYHFSPDVMTYVSAAQGYRSGGFNPMAKHPENNSYDEENLWSYEWGLKSSFWGNRLSVNGAVYVMDIKDMQVTESLASDDSFLTNAAEATSKGAELEVMLMPVEGLTFMAGGGVNDIEFDDYTDNAGDYSGKQNPYSPEYTFNIGAQYRHYSGFYVRADLVGYGTMYFDKANQYERDAYELVNAKIGYEAESYDIYLYGKNIFDETYDAEGYYSGFYTIYSDPGEVGVELAYRF